MSITKKLTKKELRNIKMNVFRTGSDYMLGPPEICNALVNPKTSDYDYFLSFESNAPSFSEGIKGLLDAAKNYAYEGFMWAVREIYRQQKNHELDDLQVWHISGFPGSSGTRLQGFHATNEYLEKEFVIFASESAVIENVTYEETIPEGVAVALWMDCTADHNLLMVPSEYNQIERHGVGA